jgi:hypothetical protein
MVMITPEEVMEMRRKSEPSDTLKPWNRDVVGDSARLDIPLDSPHLLRKVGPIIAGLAEHIKFTSQRTELSEFDILLSIKNAVRSAASEIRTIHGGALKNGSYPRKRQ